MEANVLAEHVRLHGMWLRSEPGGVRMVLCGAALRDAVLCGAALRDANLRGADLCGADLSGADLSDANLCGADLRGADLCGADLSGADLSDANLSDAYLSDANLRRAYLSDADLSDAYLSDANLRRANLRRANLCGADLCGADLSGADLSGTGVITGESRHQWYLVPSDAGPILRYGCESLPLTEFEARLPELCAEHHPSEAATYEAEIRAIIALCRTVEMPARRREVGDLKTPLDDVLECVYEMIANNNQLRISIPASHERDHDLRISTGVLWACKRIAALEAREAELVDRIDREDSGRRGDE